LIEAFEGAIHYSAYSALKTERLGFGVTQSTLVHPRMLLSEDMKVSDNQEKNED
jgi:hypothetical protein